MTTKVKKKQSKAVKEVAKVIKKRQLPNILVDVAKSQQNLLDGFDKLRSNQVELARSLTNTDAQMSVLIRMVVKKTNSMVKEINQKLQTNIPEITMDYVNALFSEWETFRRNPAHRDYLEQWFMGYDIDKLPQASGLKQEGATNEEANSNPKDGEGNTGAIEQAQQDQVPQV